MAGSLRLSVITPAETLREEEEAAWVHVRLADGTGLTVYPGHARLLAETIEAPIRYADDSGEYVFPAQEGILEVDRDSVKIYTKGASTAEGGSPSPVGSEERRFERLARELKQKLEEDQDGQVWGLLVEDTEDGQT